MKNIYRLLKWNRMVRSARVKYAALLLADIVAARCLSVRIDPVLACNLRCQMCYFSDASWREQHAGALSAADIDVVASRLFPRALQVVVGCVAEPTMCRDFVRIVKVAKDYSVPYVSLVSNGQLLTAEHLDRLLEAGLDELMLSTHGVRAATYERLMPSASHDRHLELLRLLQARRTSGSRRGLQVRINYTVNPDNLEELSLFYETYGRIDIQALQVRPMMDMGNTAYCDKGLTRCLHRYGQIVQALREESRRRGVIFMANTADPAYGSDNPLACVSEEVRRYVSPTVVWKPDFLWRDETYEDYCRRTGWRRHLARGVVFGASESKDKNLNRRRMTYDVDM